MKPLQASLMMRKICSRTDRMSEGTGFHRAYRYRLRSNRKAEAVLRRWAGCSRKVWNLALAEQQARRERGEKYAGYVTMAKWVTAWRKATETTYLAEVPVHVLQNVVRALDGAFQRFFRKEGGYPRFKRRGDPIGLRETDVKCFAVDAANGRLRFPKVGWLRYRASRPIEGRPITVTLRGERSERAGRMSTSVDLRSRKFARLDAPKQQRIEKWDTV